MPLQVDEYTRPEVNSSKHADDETLSVCVSPFVIADFVGAIAVRNGRSRLYYTLNLSYSSSEQTHGRDQDWRKSVCIAVYLHLRLVASERQYP